MVVCINELEVYAYHGCFEEEQRVGQNYIINLKLHLQHERATESDSLADTVDYDAVCREVSESMRSKSKLIEHAAANIANAILERFPLIDTIEIELIKPNPPVSHSLKAFTVVLKKSR